MPTTLQMLLERLNAAGDPVAWLLIADALQTVTGLSDPVIDQGTRDKLDDLAARIGDTGTAGTQRWLLEQIRTILDGTVTVAGTVTATQGGAGAAQWLVADDYTTEAHATDQAGADGVLEFTVAAGAMVLVDVDPTDPTDTDNYRARATTDGVAPTASAGFVCRPGTTYLPIVTAGTVKVYAPTGVTVAVQSLGRP